METRIHEVAWRTDAGNWTRLHRTTDWETTLCGRSIPRCNTSATYKGDCKTCLKKETEIMATDTTDSMYTREQIDPTDPHQVQAVAATFIRNLENLLGGKMEEMRERQREEPEGSSVCHSHDYCDANVVMSEAVMEVYGTDPFEEHNTPDQQPTEFYDPLCAVWEAAWTAAKRADYRASNLPSVEMPGSETQESHPVHAVHVDGVDGVSLSLDTFSFADDEDLRDSLNLTRQEAYALRDELERAIHDAEVSTMDAILHGDRRARLVRRPRDLFSEQAWKDTYRGREVRLTGYHENEFGRVLARIYFTTPTGSGHHKTVRADTLEQA